MWFTEDAWSPIIVCAVFGVVFFIAWSSTQRSKFLIPIPILLFAAITVFFAEQAVVTDAEQVEQNLQDLISQFIDESQQLGMGQQQTPEMIQCHRYFSTNNDADKARVAAALLMVEVSDDARTTDIQIRLTNENTRAVTHFRVNGTVSGPGFSNHYASRWELTWQKEGGRWRVTRTKMLNVMSGEEQRIPRVD